MRPAFSREHPATGVQSRFLLGQETDSSTPEGHLSPPGPTEEDRETEEDTRADLPGVSSPTLAGAFPRRIGSWAESAGPAGS